MAKIKEFNGNDYVDNTIGENEIDKTDMDNLLSFLAKHKNVYLFGEGLCGTGMAEYLSVCGYKNVRGNVTSNSFEQKLKQYQIGIDGIILSLKADYYAEILPLILKKISINDILFLKEKTKQIFTRTFSRDYLKNHMWLTLPIALHCNINCASCNMFSPLCKKELYTLDSVRRDIAVIKEINLNLNRINITGGEPFLNTEIVEILKYIRSEFESIKIDLYTNGLVINNLSDEQLEAIAMNEIEFHITEYGVNPEKLDILYQRLDRLNISYVVDYLDENKLFYKKVIDFDKSVPVYEYINCQYYTYCFALFMYNGKLFKCPMALNVDKINMYSNKKIEFTPNDYLDLSNVNSVDQIYDFWQSRLPMCDYCPRVTETFTWRKSERKIEEWM